MSSSQIRAAASLGLLLTAVIWGFAFVVVKNSLDLIPPIYMLAFRFTIAALALALIMWKRIRHISRQNWISGAAALAVGIGLAYCGKSLLTVALSCSAAVLVLEKILTVLG